jgi:hypothetical protein
MLRVMAAHGPEQHNDGASVGTSARSVEGLILSAASRGDMESVDLQRWRTRRLFDLAVTAAGHEPARVARTLGIDSRSLNDMRAVPSLGYIARIAQVLGIATGSAAEVVGHAAGTGRCELSSPGDLAAAIAHADIEDDDASLEALAEAVARSARSPADLALSVLCIARASAARGEVREARERTRSLEIPDGSDALAMVARDLRDCIDVEAALGDAWRGLSNDEPVASPRRGRKEVIPFGPSGDEVAVATARRFRHAAAGLALELLRAPAREFRGACDLLAGMRRQVLDAVDSGCPHAVAWAASLAGVAALRIREAHELPDRVGKASMSLFVSVQLVIDEEIARRGSAAPMSILRRRLRLLLHEWCDRARRGEAEDALIDECDRREIQTLCARFPRARPGAIVGSSEKSAKFRV